MNKIKPIIFILLLAVNLIGFSQNVKEDFTKGKRLPTIEKGIIDFSSFQLNETLNLDGEWLFYPNVFVNSYDESKNLEAKLIAVPACVEQVFMDSLNPKGFGYGTYQLVIKGLNPKQRYALKYTTLGPASRIFIDGINIANSGKPGDSKKTYSPYYKPQVNGFCPLSDSVVLHIQVANFDHRKFGLWHSITFGERESVLNLHILKIIINAVLFGFILIMFFYHFGLAFINRSKFYSSLYFALLALAMAIRIGLTEEMIFNYFFNIPWIWQVKLDYIVLYSTIIFASLFVHVLYPKEYKLKILYLNITVPTVISLITVFISVWLSSKILIGMQIFTLFVLLHLIYVLTIALKNKRDGALIFVIGTVFFLFIIINDILHNNGVIETLNLFSLGITGIVLSQAYVLSKRFSNAFIRAEELSIELNCINKNLEKKVVERTLELKKQNNGYLELNKDYQIRNNQYLVQNRELKEAKLEAENANSLKSDFLANMSHEIRTPMNAIIGFSSILKKRIKDEKQLSFIDKIVKSGDNLLNLINDILDLSKIEAGQLEIQKEASNSYAIFNEIPSTFMELSQRKQVPVNVIIDTNLPKLLLIDAFRIRQVLLNLVSNALKFTENGSVSIIVEVNQTSKVFKTLEVSIQVKDTGIGILENQLYTIFESFTQVEGQSTKKYGGTGLGLAITKRLVELMDGTISVESTINVGSTFKVILNNVEILDFENEIVEEKQTIYNTIKASKILHVEDIEYNRELISLFLQDENIELKEAETGKEALEILKTYTPDLILMDIQLPGLNGYETTKKIRNNEKLKSIPVIALTANATNDEIEKYSHVFDEYLTKPVDEDLLLKTIAKYLKAK